MQMQPEYGYPLHDKQIPQMHTPQMQHQMPSSAMNYHPRTMPSYYSQYPQPAPPIAHPQYAQFGHPASPSLMSSSLMSPSVSSASSFSPIGQGGSPTMVSAQFPDSPPILDASQMLMSPSRFRKRRQLSPLITGFSEPMQSPPGMLLSRRPAMPKIPVSPSSFSVGSSPRSRSANLILPCFFDQHNNLRTHGHGIDMSSGGGYGEDTRRNARSFLQEAEAIDEENITIVEIKQLLRKYSINATGKKHILMDRIKKMKLYLSSQIEGGSTVGRPPSQPSESNSSPVLECSSALPPPQPIQNNVEMKENIIPANA